MKKIYFYRLFQITVSIILFISCSPQITRSIVQEKPKKYEQVTILSLDVDAPPKSTFIGTIKISDNGFTTKCSQEEVWQEAIKECHEAGGNIIKIIKEKYPGASSTCYGLTADIYHSTIKPVNDTIKSKKNTVKLYFFRPDIHFESLRDFNIFDSDGNQILKLGNGEKLLYETHTSGELKFYAGKNGKNLFKIEVISGQEYFIVCRLVEGWVNTKFEMTQSEQ